MNRSHEELLAQVSDIGKGTLFDALRDVVDSAWAWSRQDDSSSSTRKRNVIIGGQIVSGTAAAGSSNSSGGTQVNGGTNQQTVTVDQKQSDWNVIDSTNVSYIRNKPTLRSLSAIDLPNSPGFLYFDGMIGVTRLTAYDAISDISFTAPQCFNTEINRSTRAVSISLSFNGNNEEVILGDGSFKLLSEIIGYGAAHQVPFYSDDGSGSGPMVSTPSFTFGDPTKAGALCVPSLQAIGSVIVGNNIGFWDESHFIMVYPAIGGQVSLTPGYSNTKYIYAHNNEGNAAVATDKASFANLSAGRIVFAEQIGSEDLIYLHSDNKILYDTSTGTFTAYKLNISSFTTNGLVRVSSSGDLTIDSSTYLTSSTGEPNLGNPPADGYLLSSTVAGVRSWIAPYSLPTATANALGGVMVGTGLSISAGALSVSYGTTAGTAAAGNDARLSDSRTPTAHSLDGALHTISGKTAGQVMLATSAATFGFVTVSGDATLSDGGYLQNTGLMGEALPATSIGSISAFLRYNGITGWYWDANTYITSAGSITGNAATATKLAAARTIAATGDGSWSVNFDGSANVSAALTVSGVCGYALPTLGATAGNLRWSGTAWGLDATPYLSIAVAASTYQVKITTGTTAQYLRGDLSLATFPTAVSAFANDSGYITSAGSITGNAATATKLAAARTIAATGDGSWSVSFDGSANVSGALTLTSLLTAGSAGSATAVPTLTWDAKGRLIAVGSATISIPHGQISDWATATAGYLTGNQSITLTGVVTGSGTTSIATSFTNSHLASINQDLTTTSSPTFAGITSTGYVLSMVAASDTIGQGSRLAVTDANAATKGWLLQLGASNDLAFWNLASGTWAKVIDFASGGGITATTLAVTSTSTFTGAITANGGITGNLTGTASNSVALGGVSNSYWVRGDILTNIDTPETSYAMGSVATWANVASTGTAPAGSSGDQTWWNVINARHRNGTSDGASTWGGQIAWGMTGYANVLSFRTRSGASWGSWINVLHSGNYDSYAIPLAGSSSITGALVSNNGSNLGSGGSHWGTIYVDSVSNAVPANTGYFRLNSAGLHFHTRVGTDGFYDCTISGTSTGLVINSERTSLTGSLSVAGLVSGTLAIGSSGKLSLRNLLTISSSGSTTVSVSAGDVIPFSCTISDVATKLVFASNVAVQFRNYTGCGVSGTIGDINVVAGSTGLDISGAYMGHSPRDGLIIAVTDTFVIVLM